MRHEAYDGNHRLAQCDRAAAPKTDDNDDLWPESARYICKATSCEGVSLKTSDDVEQSVLQPVSLRFYVDATDEVRLWLVLSISTALMLLLMLV